MKRAKYRGRPLSFAEFAEKYATEDACRQRVFEARWPEGFVCPKCGGKKCCFVAKKNCYQCNKCKHQTTPKVGTLMDKTPVLMAVSKDAAGKPRFMKLRAVPNLKGPTVGKFAKSSISEGSTIETDALRSYHKALSEKFNHNWEVFDAEKEMLVWLHTILSNVKADIPGTFHGVSRKYLQRYLDEISYRFNRRFMQPVLFDRLLTAVTSAPPLGLVGLVG